MFFWKETSIELSLKMFMKYSVTVRSEKRLDFGINPRLKSWGYLLCNIGYVINISVKWEKWCLSGLTHWWWERVTKKTNPRVWPAVAAWCTTLAQACLVIFQVAQQSGIGESNGNGGVCKISNIMGMFSLHFIFQEQSTFFSHDTSMFAEHQDAQRVCCLFVLFTIIIWNYLEINRKPQMEKMPV